MRDEGLIALFPSSLIFYSLREVILEFLKDVAFCLSVALEVVAFLHTLKCLFLRTAQGLRNINADVHNEVTCSVPIVLNSGQAFAAQA